jgi:MgtC family
MTRERVGRIASVAVVGGVLVVGLAAHAAGQPANFVDEAERAIANLGGQLIALRAAALGLPLAAALGAVLAFRPRRSGTPARQPAVIQTQIILAIVGALVMLVVGQSVARAFAIVGAASLVRYRAKVEDPKDAGVMLTALGIGLASGVGLYLLASFATMFVMAVLWWVESMEPKPVKLFSLKVSTADPAELKPRIEQVLRRNRATFEMRSSSANEVIYEVKLPFEERTDSLSEEIIHLNGKKETSIEWEEKKSK